MTSIVDVESPKTPVMQLSCHQMHENPCGVAAQSPANVSLGKGTGSLGKPIDDHSHDRKS